MMKVIGVTGSLGSGKSTVAAILGRYGARIIDADVIVHDLLQNDSPCFAALSDHFGPSIIRDGRLDRRRLAERVFDDEQERRFVEGVLHPQVDRETCDRLKVWRREGVAVAVLDVPLLFESGMDRLTDVTVAVRAREEQQLERVKKERGLSTSEALKRIRAQMPLEEKIRRADCVIDNDGPPAETERQVALLWQNVTGREKIDKN